MLQNYIKIAFRTLWKNKIYTIVNLLGISIAVACCVVAYLNYQYNEEFDSFHEKSASVYRVNMVRQTGNNTEQYPTSPMPMGPAIQQDLKGVDQYCRLTWAYGVVRHGDNVFNELVHFADLTFFDFFSFPLMAGEKQALINREYVFLSKFYAQKYFGNEDPIGKTLTFTLNDTLIKEFLIGGVIDEYPMNSSVNAHILANYEAYQDLYQLSGNEWNYWAHATFLEIPDPENVPLIEDELVRYIELHKAARNDTEISEYYLESMGTWAKTTRYMYGNFLFRQNLHRAAVFGPTLMAIMILLIACFNFINTAIAASGKRLKEIGIRKVLGSSQRQLILQLVGENLWLSFIAMVIGLGMAELLVPMYSELWPNLHISLDYGDNLPLIFFLIGLLLLIGLLAGLYPAFYIAKFEPTSIFRGKLSFGSQGILSHILMGLQFALSVQVIISGVVFAQNAVYMDNADVGFQREGMLVVHGVNEHKFNALQPIIEQMPKVESFTGTLTHLNRNLYTEMISHKMNKEETRVMYLGENYLETMEMRLAEGRLFNSNLSSDQETSIMVNQTFLQKMGIENGVGEIIRLDSVDYTIIGVIEDFFTMGFWDPVLPCIMKWEKPARFQTLVVRTSPEDLIEIRENVGKAWARLYPGIPYEGYTNNEEFHQAKMTTQNIRNVTVFLSLIATLLSGMGLFAMVSLKILNKLKEIGIRKVFGASVLQIIQLIGKNIVWMILLAMIAGMVPSYLFIESYIESMYAYHTPIHGWIFVLSAAILISAALFTVGGKIYFAANTNPATILRDE